MAVDWSQQPAWLQPQVQPGQSGPAIPAASTPSGSSLGQFSSSMTPDQAQALANQYLQAAGLPPDTGGQWTQYWNQFGSKDPNYFMTRLLNGMATSGGNMSQFQSLQSPTAAGGWGPGTSGFGPASTTAGSNPANPYGTNGFMGSPGYAYEQQAANNAVQASAAARGTLLSTGTLKDLASASAGIAGQAFGLDSSNLLQLSQLGANAANNAGNYLTQAGNANASGTVGATNAAQSAINGVNNAAQTAYVYNQTKPQVGGTTPTAPGPSGAYTYPTPAQTASDEEDDGQ